MLIQYNPKTDTLSVILRPPHQEDYQITTDHFSVTLDDDDHLNTIIITQASQFVAEAIAKGVPTSRSTFKST